MASGYTGKVSLNSVQQVKAPVSNGKEPIKVKKNKEK